MPDTLSNWAANTMLAGGDPFPPGSCLALFQADPTPLGSTGSEFAGGGYIRQPISMAVPASRTRVSINAQLFTGMPDGWVTYLGVMTSVGGGHLVFAKELPTPIHVLASGQFLCAKGDVAISL